MRLAFAMTALLVSGCAAATPPAPSLNDPTAFEVQPGPVGEEYLTEAPAPTTAPAAAHTQDKAVDQYGNPWTEERKAFAKKVNELAKRFAQQYRAAKRPVFRLKFRHQYPTMSEEEIEVLIDDAVEEGLRDAMQKEGQRLFGGPVMGPPVISPSISCTSSQIGSSTYTDCY